MERSDAEQGFLEGVDPELDAVIRQARTEGSGRSGAGSGARRFTGASGGPSSSVFAGGFDMGSEDERWVQFSFPAAGGRREGGRFDAD